MKNNNMKLKEGQAILFGEVVEGEVAIDYLQEQFNIKD